MVQHSVQELARAAELILVEVATAGSDAITYGELADRLAGRLGSPLPAVLMGTVLGEMRDRQGSWSWTPFLTAFVVSQETGEPGDGFYVTGMGDAAAVRAKTHERLTSGIYAAR